LQYWSDATSSRRDRNAHTILILDQAGWHGAKDLNPPDNILPPRSPELNPQENLWQFMRANWLSNHVFKPYDDIVDHCCYAWNRLIDQPWKIMSIAHRDWAARSLNLKDWYKRARPAVPRPRGQPAPPRCPPGAWPAGRSSAGIAHPHAPATLS